MGGLLLAFAVLLFVGTLLYGLTTDVKDVIKKPRKRKVVKDKKSPAKKRGKK
jgi:hypothetical protein